ncbi:TPA: Eag protein [Vibrio parahaemolyticus]|nr:Eag protein [Vibrio parahaemolyticus]
MKRAGAVCPKCGSTTRPYKEKIMGQDTQDLICADCKYTGWWTEFQQKPDADEDD